MPNFTEDRPKGDGLHEDVTKVTYQPQNANKLMLCMNTVGLLE